MTRKSPRKKTTQHISGTPLKEQVSEAIFYEAEKKRKEKTSCRYCQSQGGPRTAHIVLEILSEVSVHTRPRAESFF
jgi:hypothetical protein